MRKITAPLATCITVALPLICLAFCANKTAKAPEPAVVEAQERMAWPKTPVLSCRARIVYTQQFLRYFKEGLPEDRIIIESDWKSSEERAEVLEIRRRVYHDQPALDEVTACAEQERTWRSPPALRNAAGAIALALRLTPKKTGPCEARTSLGVPSETMKDCR